MDIKIPDAFLRDDDVIKNQIIENVIEATAKEALKDGQLYNELQAKNAIELIKSYDAPDKNILKKKTSNAFGKDIFLLGCDETGQSYWLEAPKWDCGWYWGFGYVETYTRNWQPSASRDIDSHSHIDSSFMGSVKTWDHEKGSWKREYISNIYDGPHLKYTTFNESEGWTLSELFKSFYLLKDAAALFRNGSAHITDNPKKNVLQDKKLEKRINDEMIPAITAEIISILTPAK